MSKKKDGASRREFLIAIAFAVMGLAAAGTGGALLSICGLWFLGGTPLTVVPVDDLPDVGDEAVLDMKSVLRRRVKQK